MPFIHDLKIRSRGFNYTAALNGRGISFIFDLEPVYVDERHCNRLWIPFGVVYKSCPKELNNLPRRKSLTLCLWPFSIMLLTTKIDA